MKTQGNGSRTKLQGAPSSPGTPQPPESSGTQKPAARSHSPLSPPGPRFTFLSNGRASTSWPSCSGAPQRPATECGRVLCKEGRGHSSFPGDWSPIISSPQQFTTNPFASITVTQGLGNQAISSCLCGQCKEQTPLRPPGHPNPTPPPAPATQGKREPSGKTHHPPGLGQTGCPVFSLGSLVHLLQEDRGGGSQSTRWVDRTEEVEGRREG